MPTHMPFFTWVMGKIEAGLATYVDTVVNRMSEIVTPLAGRLLVLYVCWFCYQLMFGTVQEPIRSGSMRIVKAGVIVGLINAANYNLYIADFFLTAPDQLAASISGQVPEQSVNFLDTLWWQQYDFGDRFWQMGTAAGWSGIGLQIVACVVWLSALLTTGGSAVLLIISKVGLHAWLGFGQFFVLLALFDATKQFTNAWLGQVITFALYPMLTASVIYLILHVTSLFLDKVQGPGANPDPQMWQFCLFFLLCFAAGIFLIQLPSFASGLGGGVAISTLGAMTAGYRALKGAAGSGKDLMTGKTLSDMRGARRERARNAEWAKENPGMSRRAAGLPMKAYRALTNLRKNTVTKS